MSSGKPIKLRITAGHTLLLTGPTEYNIREGEAHCFGSPLSAGNWTRVESLRQEPIFATQPVEAEIRLGAGGDWMDVNEPTIPTGWSEAAQILQRQGGVAVVVGEVDSGKSSLCTFLANMCVESGMRVGIVDGDVGQADIGPPATISSSRIVEPIRALHYARNERSFFIGDTSPSSVSTKLVRLMVRLKEKLAETVDLVVVNTDGWIADPGALRHKEELLIETRPNLVIGLSRADEIDPLLSIATVTALKLKSSRYAKTRSKDERKRNREAGYQRFLLGSKPMKIDLDNIQLRPFDHPEQSIFRGNRRFKGYLVGLLKRDQELLGIGRIGDTNEHYVTVETQTEMTPSTIEIGNLVLSSRYEEVEYGLLH